MLIQGDSALIPLPDKSVHCCVTSPPYWGLRKYSGDQSVGMFPDLGLEKTPQEHIERIVAIMAEVYRVLRDDGVVWLNYGDCYAGSGKGAANYPGDYPKQNSNTGSLSQVGVDAYRGIPDGNLMLMPHRIAIALQDWGWIVRQDLIWYKRNPMPESVNGRRWERSKKEVDRKEVDWNKRPKGWQAGLGSHDSGSDSKGQYRHEKNQTEAIYEYGDYELRRGSWRHTRAHEYVFMLTKKMQYYSNQEAVREGYTEPLDRWGGEQKSIEESFKGDDENTMRGLHRDREMRPNAGGRNPRSVLDVPTAPYSGKVETSHLRRVEVHEVSDGMMHIAFPYCQHHESLAIQLAKEFCDEHEADWMNHIEHIYNHLFQERPNGSFPTHQHDEHCFDACNSDWLPPLYSPSAIDHNNAFHKMALSLGNAIPYMPFFEMIDYIADKRELLSYFVQHLCIYGSKILSDDFPASLSRKIPHRILDNGHYEALRASDCSCLFYEYYTKKSDHFATYPPNLIAPLIRATCPRWACPVCGQGWSPVVEKPNMDNRPTRAGNSKTETTPDIHLSNNWEGYPKSAGQKYQDWRNENPNTVKSYRPTCEHPHTKDEAVPGIVLDPFVGSGTTVMVAKQLLRRGIGLDISLEYLDMQAKVRTGLSAPSNQLEGLPMFENHVMPGFE